MNYCLDVYQNFFVDTLDTLWYTQEISKDMEYPKCIKKFIENGICNNGFNQTFIFNHIYKKR